MGFLRVQSWNHFSSTSMSMIKAEQPKRKYFHACWRHYPCHQVQKSTHFRNWHVSQNRTYWKIVIKYSLQLIPEKTNSPASRQFRKQIKTISGVLKPSLCIGETYFVPSHLAELLGMSWMVIWTGLSSWLKLRAN